LKKFPRDLFNMSDQCDKSNGVELNGTNNNGELNWARTHMPVMIFQKASTVGEKLFFLKIILMKLSLWTKNRDFIYLNCLYLPCCGNKKLKL